MVGNFMTHKYSVRYWIGETWFNLRENLPFFALFIPPYHYNIKENVSCLSWNFANNLQYYPRPPTFSKSITLMGSPYAQIGRIKATLSYPK